MKKIFTTLALAIISLTTFAQAATDKYTVTTTDGNSTTHIINDENHLKFTDANTLVNYITGFEEFGTHSTWNVDNIKSITFDIAHNNQIDVTGVNLADANATDATKKLYKYLQLIYGNKILSGIMADVAWNHNEADTIYTLTGKYPAINCYDFIHIGVPENNGWINYNNITPVTEWAEAGGIVNLMWHFNVPVDETTVIGRDGSGQAISSPNTTFKAANALITGTWENTFFMQQLEKVANVILKLQDAGVVALWRPFHEAAGNATLKSVADWRKAWFWWGEDGAETYKELWRVMFNYFTNKGIHNLIWEWTSQNYNGNSEQFYNDSDWYPGDSYVDIIGRDLYGYNAAKQAIEYSQLKALYPTKMITLSECGSNKENSTVIPTADIAEAWNAGAKWLNFMPWYGENMPSNEWWNKVMDEEVVITRDEVNQNATYIEETAQSAVNNFGLGWNLGNTLETNGAWIGNHQEYSKYETAWGQPLTTQAMFTFLKKNGFNAVRIPVTWVQHMDDEGNVDADWMARVKEVVDYAMNAGLYTIINVHHDTGAGELAWIKADTEVYNNTKDKFKKLWTQIANTFAEYDQHLIFEGYNEMLDNSNTWNAPKASSGYTALDNYAQDFVDAVRATGGNNTTRNLIVNTYAAAKGSNVLNNFTIPTDKVANHLIAEVHSYDPWNFINTHTTWDDDCQNTLKGIFTDLNNKFTNIPYIIGEYGTSGEADESGKETVVNKESPAAKIQMAADQAANMVSLCKQNNSASFYWMSIFDGTDRSVPQWSLPTVVEAMQKANE